MKWILIAWLLASTVAFSQTEPVFGLEVAVHYCRTRGPVPNAPVIVSDTAGNTLFEGCTDSLGKVAIDSAVIRPHGTYAVHLGDMPGFYSSRWGTQITTEGLEASQQFRVDMMPLVLSECFSCYAPHEAATDTIIAEWKNTIPALEEEFGITTSRLAVWIHYETWDHEKELMKRARYLRRKLRKEFPGMIIERAIQLEYHPDHRHDACLRVVRIS